MTVAADLVRLVETRAAGRCEYCQMHQALQGATFHVEHILPRSRGGESTAANLAWCCPSCNLHKSDRIEAIDPVTGNAARVFNPRGDDWVSPVQWSGFQAVGKTPDG